MKPIIFARGIIKLLPVRIIFKQIISIVLLSIILGLFRNYFISINNITLIKDKKIADKMVEGIFAIPDFMTEPQIVSTDFVKYYFNNLNVTIIDARDEDQYNQLHIEESINIPYNYYEQYDILYELALDDIYIIYCNGGECSLSLDLAYIMYDEFDFESVFVYEEGLPIWKDHNYPLSSNVDNKKLIDNTNKNILISDIVKFIGIFCFTLIYLFFIIKTVRENRKSKKEILNTILVVSFRLTLGYIFIYASIQKIVNPLEFSNQIDLYKATPLLLNNIIAS